jgi:hypothetical protein
MHRTIIAICTVALLAPALLLASPSGLNNIPTADYTQAGQLVLQAYGTLASGADNSLFLGAKFGLGNGIEVGADRLMAPSPDGPLAFQVKKTWSMPVIPLKLCAGLANITDATGDHPLYPYGVASYHLPGASRAHLGIALPEDNHQLLAGFDYTLGDGTMLRTDLVRGFTGGNQMTLYSLGALVPKKFGAVEGWITRGIDSAPGGGNSTALTLKVDFSLKLF